MQGVRSAGRPYGAIAGGLCAVLWALGLPQGGAAQPPRGPLASAFGQPVEPNEVTSWPAGTAVPGGPVFSPPGLQEPFCADTLDGGVEAGPQLRRWLREAGRQVRADHAHYYARHTLRDLALGVALAAPIANTSLDHDFRNWWQDDVRSSGTDRTAAFWKVFGEGVLLIPATACLSLAGRVLEERPVFDLAGEFGNRATRAYLVGAPSVLFMQVLLGASRPGETVYDSRWKPFDDSNAVSGHAFVGAVPFLAAAQMTESRAARALLYFGSACTAWSRVNDDAHYLSQAILGWYMAYLACRSVHATEYDLEPLTLVPLAGAEFSGLGLVWRR